MTTSPLFLNEGNLSIAWAKAFEAVLARGVRGLAPLIVNITGLEEKEIEVPAIRKLLDDALRRQGHADCHRWRTRSSRHSGSVRRVPADTLRPLPEDAPQDKAAGRRQPVRYLFRADDPLQKTAPDINQLEHLFGIWETVKRPTAYQLNIFDPARDHTRQPLRGFPCLQHVSFTPLGMGKMSVVATYPAQYLFERAYGNYLGLYRLGKFVAGELKLDLDPAHMCCWDRTPRG